jgi:UDPglucose 6-dehydrogenase
MNQVWRNCSEARGRNLFFSTQVEKAIEEAQVIFISVNTQQNLWKRERNGSWLEIYWIVCQTNCKGCKRQQNSSRKSTLPVRTAEAIKSILDNTGNGAISNFVKSRVLAEGTVDDLLHPDRILIGGDSSEDGQKAYKRWLMCTQIGFLLIKY